MSTQKNSYKSDRNYRHTGKKPLTDNRWAAEFVGWVNMEIADDQRSEFELWAQGTDVWGLLDTYTATGHKFTTSYDDANVAHVASVFCRNETSPNAGLMVSQRSGSVGRALLKLLFLLEGRPDAWGAVATPKARDW